MLPIRLLLACCLCLPALASPLDPSKSAIKFGFAQMNVPVEGAFKKFSGDIAFDPKLATGKVNIQVELSAADAGSDDANQAMQMSDWFNTARYPRASFVASQFKPLGQNRFAATGQLSLKGRVAMATVPFALRQDSKGVWFEGSLPLSRLAWHIGEGEWSDVGAVADAVQVKFKLFVPQ